ncbi:MAG: hypothetical protein E7570_06085 [Ruminococcaceae bacterium]|nr:hypothetical protein [Oscillospiraceae bacterium]
MNEVRKKQKLFKKIMRVIVIVTAIFMLAYIGVAPAITSVSVVTALNYVSDILVIVSLVLVLLYYSRYSKLELFLNDVEGEIEDCGYYLTAREEKEIADYFSAVEADLKSNGFRFEKDLELSELEFDGRALKTKEFFYLVCVDELDKNDIIAYLDAAVYDVTVGNLRRKGNCVVAFICSSVDENALSLSKAVTAMGRKNQLKFTPALVDVKQGRVYFSGLNPTKCQQMTANFLMKCSVPIDDKYKGQEKLKFQYELEEKMKSFTINDFKNGTFNIH